MVTLRYAVGGVRKRRGHTECATGMSSFFFFFSLFHLLLFERVDLRFCYLVRYRGKQASFG